MALVKTAIIAGTKSLRHDRIECDVALFDAHGVQVEVGEADLSAYIPLTQRGAASGVASLDSSSKVPVAQVPNLDAAKIATGTLAQGRLPAHLDPTSLVATFATFVDDATGEPITPSGRLLIRVNTTTNEIADIVFEEGA